jgi:hypothetical protein
MRSGWFPAGRRAGFLAAVARGARVRAVEALRGAGLVAACCVFLTGLLLRVAGGEGAAGGPERFFGGMTRMSPDDCTSILTEAARARDFGIEEGCRLERISRIATRMSASE